VSDAWGLSFVAWYSVGETGGVEDSRTDGAVRAAIRFAHAAERAGATDMIVVATSALRIASNSDGLLERIEDEIGREVRTISGEAKAILAYVGTRAGLSLADEPTVIADLGGGSLDLARGVSPHVLSTASLPRSDRSGSPESGSSATHHPPRNGNESHITSGTR
jgi:exopolyphosphatase/pppGpp-phosphohydrolase